MGFSNRVRTFFEHRRLEQKYVNRSKRASYMSDATYVDGEYTYSPEATMPTSSMAFPVYCGTCTLPYSAMVAPAPPPSEKPRTFNSNYNRKRRSAALPSSSSEFEIEGPSTGRSQRKAKQRMSMIAETGGEQKDVTAQEDVAGWLPSRPNADRRRSWLGKRLSILSNSS